MLVGKWWALPTLQCSLELDLDEAHVAGAGCADHEESGAGNEAWVALALDDRDFGTER